jgi:transposase-like protein
MHALCDYADTGEWVRVSFAHLNTLRSKSLATSALSTLPATDLAEILPERLAKASRKKQMVLAVEVNANPALTPIADKQSVRHLAQSFGVYPSTVYRYRNTYNHHGREERYLVEKVRGGKDRKRITPEAEKAIEQAINQIYLTLERNSKAVTYEEGRRLCYRNQIKPVPSYNTVRCASTRWRMVQSSAGGRARNVTANCTTCPTGPFVTKTTFRIPCTRWRSTAPP